MSPTHEDGPDNDTGTTLPPLIMYRPPGVTNKEVTRRRKSPRHGDSYLDLRRVADACCRRNILLEVILSIARDSYSSCVISSRSPAVSKMLDCRPVKPRTDTNQTIFTILKR